MRSFSPSIAAMRLSTLSIASSVLPPLASVRISFSMIAPCCSSASLPPPSSTRFVNSSALSNFLRSLRTSTSTLYDSSIFLPLCSFSALSKQKV